MKNVKSVLLGLTFALSVSNAHALTVNLVNNGGFEAQTVSGQFTPYSKASQGLTGWTIGVGSVDLVSNVLWNPASGVNSLDLNGTKKGEIHQSLNTTAGQLYQLSFDLAGNVFGTPSLKKMSVNVGGNSTYTFDVAGKSATNMGWTNYATNFFATSQSTTLSFLSNVSGNAGAALDNISVTAVPEAQTYSMMLLGLGLMGFIARRRRGD